MSRKNAYKSRNKNYNWFEIEAKKDIKGLSTEQQETAFMKAIKQWKLEKFYKHNQNFLPLKKAVIKYFISLWKNKENKELAKTLNQNPYIYTGLAWFESFAEI